MALRRSASTKTTFSMYATRKTKYQKALAVVNVLLLLGALTLTFFGVVLKISYYMDKLGMVSMNFVVLQWLSISVGVVTFIVAGMGFIFSATEVRGLILTFAVSMALLVPAQFTAVFFASEVRRSIDDDVFTNYGALDTYRDEKGKETWDFLQEDLRCCGALKYTDYSTGYFRNMVRCVPPSCCFGYGTENFQDCTDAISDESKSCKRVDFLVEKIHTRGCFNILDEIYTKHLPRLMLIYLIGGTLFAVIEIIGVSLAFAFAAQINRRRKREHMDWQPGEDLTRGPQDSMAMSAMEH